MKTETTPNVLVPLVGTITQFNPNGGMGHGFGIINAEIGGKTVSYGISLQTGPRIVKTGTHSPFFNGSNVDKLPENANRVVFCTTVVDEKGHTRVTAWAYESDWRAAEKLIAGRIQTRPAQSARFMAKFTKAAVASVVKKNPVAMAKQANRKPLTTVLFSTACVAEPPRNAGAQPELCPA